MRILFLSSVFPNEIEPTKGCFNQALVRALALHHQVEVVSPIPWTDLLKARLGKNRLPLFHRERCPDGFDVHYVPYLYTPGILRSWYGRFYWMSIARTIRHLIRRQHPDLVISYWAHPDGEAAVRISRMTGAPSSVIIGGSDVLLATRAKGRRRKIVSVLSRADAVITVNDHLKAAVERLGVSGDKVHVWRQGIDRRLFRPGDRFEARVALGVPDRGRMIVWAGRMVPVKGLDLLLEACAMLTARGVAYDLYLIGDGPLKAGLQARIEGLGLSDRVSLVGPKSHEELPKWLRAADLTVLPSRSEGLPNVLRESLACGTPFVAADVGGIREIARPGTSILVPPNDPPALADAIEEGLSSWGGRPLESQPVFDSWEDSAEALIQVLQPHRIEGMPAAALG